jgi:hypothetical protein
MSSAPSNYPFEITRASFVPATKAAPDKVVIEVTRHLSLTEKVDELYLNYILRAENTVPGYYGDDYFRRVQTPVPPELDAAQFTITAEARHMTSSQLPNGPAKPHNVMKHLFEIEHIIKDPPYRERNYFMLRLT